MTTSVVVVVLAGQALTAGPYFGVCTAVLALFLISTLWFNDADQGLTTVVGLLLTWQALIGPSIVLATALFGAYLAVNFCIADADQSTLAASRRRPADAFKGKTVWCVPRACIGRPPTGAAFNTAQTASSASAQSPTELSSAGSPAPARASVWRWRVTSRSAERG